MSSLPLVACALMLNACTVLAEVVATDLRDDGGPGSADARANGGADADDSFCYRISPGCPSGWQTLEGSCSCYLAEFDGTLRDGYDLCVSYGAHLLSIESLAEQNAVKAQLDGGGTDFYLGLFYRGDGWQWDTGESLSSTGFSALQDMSIPPLDRHCVEFDTDREGQWFPASCLSNDVVCELDGKQAQSPPF